MYTPVQEAGKKGKGKKRETLGKREQKEEGEEPETGERRKEVEAEDEEDEKERKLISVVSFSVCQDVGSSKQCLPPCCRMD